MNQKSENNETRVKTLANKRFKRKLTFEEMIEEFNRDTKENSIKKEDKRKKRK